MLAVADDVVALVKQIGEPIFFENLQLLDEFRDFLVGGIGVRDVGDFLDVTGHPVFLHAPEFRLAVVVRDEERSIHDASVALALAVILGGDGDVVRLIFPLCQ